MNWWLVALAIWLGFNVLLVVALWIISVRRDRAEKRRSS